MDKKDFFKSRFFIFFPKFYVYQIPRKDKKIHRAIRGSRKVIDKLIGKCIDNISMLKTIIRDLSVNAKNASL